MSHVTTFLTPMLHVTLSLMSHVEFKKCPCRCVDVRGLGPHSCRSVLPWSLQLHGATQVLLHEALGQGSPGSQRSADGQGRTLEEDPIGHGGRGGKIAQGTLGGLPKGFSSSSSSSRQLTSGDLEGVWRALDGGFPMSHVDFKKWQCQMSLSRIFFNVACRIKEMTMSPVTTF